MLAATTIPSLLASAPSRDQFEYAYELASKPAGWLGVLAFAVLVAACGAILWMYRHEGRRGASLRLRTGLAVIRCLVILLLALILLEPVRVRYLRRIIDSYTVVLVDNSASMGLADAYPDEENAKRVRTTLEVEALPPTRRVDLAGHLLSRDRNRLLQDLARDNRVKLYTFSEEPHLQASIAARRDLPDASGAGKPALQQPADVALQLDGSGGATNIERAIRRSVESLGGAPVAGVVLLTDGGINQGESWEEVARYASDRRLPIHVVGVGDPAPPRNVRVTEMVAPQAVLRQDPFAITVQLASQGLDGERIELRLREMESGTSGEGRVVETRSVDVGSDGVISPATFTRRTDRVGRYTYVAEVERLPNESVADDNRKQVTVNVIDSRVRVLLISGAASWEYRFLSRLLTRDETFDLSCWLQGADLYAVRDGNTIIDHLPDTAEELFEFDAILLLAADPDEFTHEWCRLVDTLVTEYGGGVLVTSSRAHTPALMRAPHMEPLVDLLPIAVDPEVDLVLNLIGHYQTRAAPITVPEASRSHPILRLEGEPASEAVWEQVTDVFWHYPVRRAKQVATVLMQHGDPRMRNEEGGHVLAAVQYVGAGRSAFVGFDSTWRWRRSDPAYFDQFWVQMVRYLVEGKRLGQTKRGVILTEGDQFAVGEAITINARLLDEQYRPITQESVIATSEIEGDRSSLVLRAAADNPGWFEGRLVAGRVGAHRVGVRLPAANGGEPLEVSREIYVSRPNIEVLSPQMEREALRRLAAGSAGGRYFDVDEAAQIPPLLEDVHEETMIRSRPTMLWDNGWMLTLLIVMLGVEWALRKWNRLL